MIRREYLAAPKEPDMNNPWLTPGVGISIIYPALKELNISY